MFGDENFGDFIAFKEALPGHAKASNYSNSQTNESLTSNQSSTEDSQRSSQESRCSSHESGASSNSEYLFFDHNETGQLVPLHKDSSVTVAEYLKYFSE